MSRKRTNTDNEEGQIPLGMPLAGGSGFVQTPLDLVTGGMRNALDSIRSGPQGGITQADIEILAKLAEAAAGGNLDAAIELAREGASDQAARLGIVRRMMRWLCPGRQTTAFDRLLSMLFNARAVSQANAAQEKCAKAMSKSATNLLDQLKQMASHSLLADVGRFHKQLYGHIELPTCDVCGAPAVGEVRVGTGVSHALCSGCVENAQAIQKRHRNAIQALIGALQDARIDLQAALAADRNNEPARTNLRACETLLGTLQV